MAREVHIAMVTEGKVLTCKKL
uniref:Uncharacterized protein n=1 Tax=Anguilla anguilla TaxID=7936 RepID=A0A0E9RSK1_ANGAN